MTKDEKTLRELLKAKGFGDNKVDTIIEQFKNQDNPSDLLARLLASENLGKTSEEKVFVNGNLEIPFCKTETNAEMGIDGDIQEKKKETYFATSGNLSKPPIIIDKHLHLLTEDDWFDCLICFKKGCSDCMILNMDRFGFITIARHYECLLCDHCKRPSNSPDDYSDMHIFRDKLNNIVEAYHKKCGFLQRAIRFFFMKVVDDSEKGKFNGRYIEEIKSANNSR